eukprot:gene10465-11596_t
MVLDENQKIGVGLIVLGLGFVFVGMMMFFDASLIALGNILFLLGICFAIGFQRTFTLFTRPDRIRGTLCFFTGIVLVVFRWGLIGICLEAFGFLNLFGNFLPVALSFARQFPYIGAVLDLPMIAPAVDFLAGKTIPKYVV